MPDLAPILELRLLPQHLRLLRTASTVSEGLGVELYLVGGTVRDILLGQPPADLDLVGVGSLEELASALVRELDGEVVARSEFHTFKLRLGKLRLGDAVVDLATARQESYVRPGALPTVSPGSIHEDLARRDFSINAMAVCLAPADEWGRLLDPLQGREDIDRRIVRTLHPVSFRDDATRILRAVRYAGRLDFEIAPETRDMIQRQSRYLESITGDRLRHELGSIFREERAASILALAEELGVLRAVHPGLRFDEAMAEKLRLVEVEPTPENDLLVLSLLTYAASAPLRSAMTARLNMSSSWAAAVRDTGSIRDGLDRLAAPDLRPSQVYRLLRGYTLPAVRGCALAVRDPTAACRLERYDRDLRHVRTCLDGDDLLGMGVSQGPLVGRLLNELLDARLDGVVSTRADEVDLVRRWLRQSQA